MRRGTKVKRGGASPPCRSDSILWKTTEGDWRGSDARRLRVSIDARQEKSEQQGSVAVAESQRIRLAASAFRSVFCLFTLLSTTQATSHQKKFCCFLICFVVCAVVFLRIRYKSLVHYPPDSFHIINRLFSHYTPYPNNRQPPIRSLFPPSEKRYRKHGRSTQHEQPLAERVSARPQTERRLRSLCLHPSSRQRQRQRPCSWSRCYGRCSSHERSLRRSQVRLFAHVLQTRIRLTKFSDPVTVVVAAVLPAAAGAALPPSLPEAATALTETPTATLARAVVNKPAVLATASGKTASTSPVLPTLVLSASCSVSPTTPTSSTAVSTSRSTTISLSRPAVKAFPSPSPPSPTLLSTTTLSATLSSLATRSLPPSRSTRSPLSWVVVT